MSTKDHYTDNALAIYRSGAMVQAQSLDHKYIGSEHFLLAIASQEGQCVGKTVLLNLGITREDIEREIITLIGHGVKGD